MCQQAPPRPWLQVKVPPLFGESGVPCLVTLLTRRCISRGIIPQRLRRLPLLWRQHRRQHAVAQYYVPSPLQEASPPGRKQRYLLKQLPVDVPPELLTNGQGLPPTHADQSADLRPTLWGLDMAQAVRSICPGHLGHITASLLQCYSTDLGPHELSASLMDADPEAGQSGSRRGTSSVDSLWRSCWRSLSCWSCLLQQG